MSIVSEQTALEHCRADGVDVGLVKVYLAAAEDAVCAYLNRKVYEDEAALKAALANESATKNDMVANASIAAAILLITGHLYENREQNTSAAVSELKTGAFDLLRPYRLNNGV